MTLPVRSPIHSTPPKNKKVRKPREFRKLERQRDSALTRLSKLKAKQRNKKTVRQRRILGRKLVNLTTRSLEGLLKGEL